MAEVAPVIDPEQWLQDELHMTPDQARRAKNAFLWGGWAPMEVVAHLVQAAGGKVSIPHTSLLDPKGELFISSEEPWGSMTITFKPEGLSGLPDDAARNLM